MINRRELVETYLRYDARKKGTAVPPDLAQWDWSSADEIDARLADYGFKHGIISGYREWQPIDLGYAELSRCAIVSGIFPGLPRVLGELSGVKAFKAWKPDREVEWLETLDSDAAYPNCWPLILRPAVLLESPATWYLEDGSGRAICFFRNLVRTCNYVKTAFGYVGIMPDTSSTFMRQRFPSLLGRTPRRLTRGITVEIGIICTSVTPSFFKQV